mmetsp:Transcript_123223/g.355974  ORF Transcript_123223/g.355974 Transcript_123223/m.355974 type:complete len:242 (+) Transcript_123223:1581-2306(+)
MQHRMMRRIAGGVTTSGDGHRTREAVRGGAGWLHPIVVKADRGDAIVVPVVLEGAGAAVASSTEHLVARLGRANDDAPASAQLLRFSAGTKGEVVLLAHVAAEKTLRRLRLQLRPGQDRCELRAAWRPPRHHSMRSASAAQHAAGAATARQQARPLTAHVPEGGGLLLREVVHWAAQRRSKGHCDRSRWLRLRQRVPASEVARHLRPKLPFCRRPRPFSAAAARRMIHRRLSVCGEPRASS